MREFPIPTHIVFTMMKDVFEFAEMEVCGILIGRQGRVEFVRSMSNIAEFPHIEYTFEPLEQIEAFTSVYDSGFEVLAVYHSHVAREAYPSPADIHFAAYPEMRYVILNQEAIRAFRIVDLVVTEEKIVLDY